MCIYLFNSRDTHKRKRKDNVDESFNNHIRSLGKAVSDSLTESEREGKGLVIVLLFRIL